VTLLGIGLNAVVPDEAFETVLNMSALGTITAWSLIVLCHLRLVRRWKAGTAERPRFRLPGSPWTAYATLVFLAAVLVLMALDHPVGTWTVATIAVTVPALVGGWFAVRGRVRTIAAERAGQSPPE
jgi:L-asparagine permease